MRLAAALLLSLVATAATAAPIPVRLQDGASWMLKVELTRTTERAGKTEEMSLATTQRLTWKKGANNVGLLTVTPVSATPGPGVPPEVAQAAQFEIPVIVEVDGDLAPQSVVNMAELRKSLQATLARLGAGQDTQAVERIFAGITDAGVSALATKDLGQLALVQGSNLDVGRDVSYDDSLPNPLGGTPIFSHGTVRLDALDRQAGTAVILWRQSYDPQSVTKSLTAIVDKVAASGVPARADEARAMLATMKLERDDSCRYVIDLKTGLVASADCTNKVIAGGGNEVARRTERRVYTQTLPEAR